MRTIDLKRCSKGENCIHPDGPDLPATLEYFGKRAQCKDGLNPRCRMCHNAHQRELKRKNADSYYAKQREWYHATKDEPERKRRKSESGKRYYAANKDRVLAKRSERKEEMHLYFKVRKPLYLKTERGRAVHRAQTQRRRALVMNAPGHHTADDIQALLSEQDGLCNWCGESLGSNYHVDHIQPLSRGGSNWPSNLCLSCPSCNLSRQDKLPSEWDGRRL